MDIKDLQQAEILLVETTQYDDIKEYIEKEVETWNLEECGDYSNLVIKLKEFLFELYKEIYPSEEENDVYFEAIQWIVFEKIHGVLLPHIKEKFLEEDKQFYEKCKLLYNINVSAEHFGADENYSIPLSAAIVELSIIDKYKSPYEKMHCLCSTYDLVFAEIKTAMVSVISQNSERENEIPIIDNKDVIPVLMVVIIKSKLSHMISNLFYIKNFYDKMKEKRIISDIFKSFETAVDKLKTIDVEDLHPIRDKVIKSIDLEEYMKITSEAEEEEKINKSTLVNEANKRVLNLITRSTSENELF